MSDLIERLEAATEGSADLDFAIAELVGTLDMPVPEVRGAPHYTTSLDAKLPGENIVTVIRVLGGFIAEHAEVYESGDVRCFKSTAATEALARRSAALRARQSETADGSE